MNFDDDYTLKITVLSPIKVYVFYPYFCSKIPNFNNSGDQIVQSYIYEGAPLRDRQEELNSYGFVCDCPKCTRQAAAKLVPKAAPKKDKQKR